MKQTCKRKIINGKGETYRYAVENGNQFIFGVNTE